MQVFRLACVASKKAGSLPGTACIGSQKVGIRPPAASVAWPHPWFPSHPRTPTSAQDLHARGKVPTGALSATFLAQPARKHTAEAGIESVRHTTFRRSS